MRDRETLTASMALMRQLLLEAQTKFRKMVDDNRRLAQKIDSSILAANYEVDVLRSELADTNRRLKQIRDSSPGPDGGGRKVDQEGTNEAEARENICKDIIIYTQ